MSKGSYQKEKQHLAIGKPKLINARKLREIYYVDPKDVEFMDTMKKCAKDGSANEISYALHFPKYVREEIFEGAQGPDPESLPHMAAPTRRTERRMMHALLQPTNLQESASKRLNIEIMKITLAREGSRRKSRSRQRVGKVEKLASVAREQSQEQKKRVPRAGVETEQSCPFCDAHGLMPLEKFGVGANVPETQRSRRTPR